MDIFLFLTYIIVGSLGFLIGRTFFLKLGILDRPGKDVPARKPVPTLLGVVCIGIFIVLLFITKYITDISYGISFLGLFIGGAIIAFVSIIDELGYLIDKKYSISPLLRILIQVLVSGGARFFSGVGVDYIQIPGLPMLELSGFLSLLATIAWFVLFINAINRFDGIYGLASGMSSIGFLTIFLLLLLVVFPAYEFMSYERSELLIRVQIISGILFVVSCLATIVEYKPWGLMRDVGTMFFGFCLGYLSLLGGAKIGTIIVVLALPFFDAIRVIIDRIKRGKLPYAGDYSHLHYRLLTLNWNRDEIRFFVWGRSLFFMILMLLLGTDRIGKLIIFGLMAIIFFGVNIYLFWCKKYNSVYLPNPIGKK